MRTLNLPLPIPAAALLLACLAVPGMTQAQNAGAYPTQYLQMASGRIAYDDSGGKGPLVLAIPGMGDLRSEYRWIRPLLQQGGYRIVTMDVRGHGETSAKWDDYSAHAVGTDAAALIAHLGAGPAVILGNSFSGGAALWAAHDAPAQVRGVVLLGPVLRDAHPSWLARLSLKAGFAGPWNVWMWTMYWDSLFPTRKPADHEQARAALAQNLHEPGRMTALINMVELSKSDTTAMLPTCHVPALVVIGTLDPDFADPVAEAQWIAAQIGAQTLMVEGAGHYPQTEMPQTVAPAVLAFLAQRN